MYKSMSLVVSRKHNISRRRKVGNLMMEELPNSEFSPFVRYGVLHHQSKVCLLLTLAAPTQHTVMHTIT